MITARKKHHGKCISSEKKLTIALQAIQGKQTVTDISREHDVSRTTVYKQKDKALTAAHQAFEPEDDRVLFYIPVTKAFIFQVVIALFLICKSSYRNIMFFLKCIFNYHVSLGAVFNIIDEAADKAISINQSYDLSTIKTSAADELFHRNKPILSAVDIDSRFCALLAKADHRDYETWGVHLLDLQRQGYAPSTTIIDAAKGLTKGHQEVLPKTVLRYDHFHIIKDLKDCCRFLKNKEASAITAGLKLYKQAEKERAKGRETGLSEDLSSTLNEINELEETHKTFKLLAQWLQHDILQLAGHPPTERAMLYDFIVEEMAVLATKHPHRISDILTSLNTQRAALLDVANTLNEKFAELAVNHGCSIDVIWSTCYAARYAIDSCKYNEKAYELESVLGPKYETIEDEVLLILESTHRCSSIVENFNSRLRPYLDERKFISPKILALIQFYLNHKPFMRSKHERLINKTPAESMTEKPHKPWLEMLGFSRFQFKAA